VLPLQELQVEQGLLLLLGVLVLRPLLPAHLPLLLKLHGPQVRVGLVQCIPVRTIPQARVGGRSSAPSRALRLRLHLRPRAGLQRLRRLRDPLVFGWCHAV
jgi:hypothetical protein